MGCGGPELYIQAKRENSILAVRSKSAKDARISKKKKRKKERSADVNSAPRSV